MAPRSTVVTPGNYDGVHLGHRALVRAARERAARESLTPVAMFFDPHPLALLGPGGAPELLTSPKRRCELIERCGASCFVQTFDAAFASLDPTSFVKDVLVAGLGARAVVVGPDFRFGHGRAGTLELLRSLAVELEIDVIVVPKFEVDGARVSSSRIREALGNGQVAAAARLLGRYHDVEGRVEKGAQRGRTLGFPTANLADIDAKLPEDGVYVIAARHPDGKRWLRGVANLGTRPTFDAGRSVEAHLFDFDGDLYDSNLRIAFVERLRGEAKFSSKDALVAQIRADVALAREARIVEELVWI